MITPDFTISQDENTLTILITAPHVKAKDVDFFIDGSHFKFYIKPYFLRLNLPARVVEDDRAQATYDVAKGEVKVILPKETPGEHFADLDLLTKLLAPAKKNTATTTTTTKDDGNVAATKRSLIEVVGGDSRPEPGNDEDFEWELPQELPSLNMQTSGNAKYGFNDAYSGVFNHHREAGNEVLELADPEHSSPASRREERMMNETLKFDEDYYLAELYNTETLDHMSYTPEWRSCTSDRDDSGISIPIQDLQLDDQTKEIKPASSWLLSETDKKEMRQLTNKEFLIDDPRLTYLGLVDILYSYCYDHRATEGESNTESAWTIAKLSPMMAALETPSSPSQLMIALYRRSLAYPLYRSWALNELVREDVQCLLRSGKRGCLKALLEMNRIFEGSDVYHVYSKIWIHDYCVWIMGASDKALRSLAREVENTSLRKSDLGWDLEEIEEAATKQPEQDAEETTEEEEEDEDSSRDGDDDETDYSDETVDDDDDGDEEALDEKTESSEAAAVSKGDEQRTPSASPTPPSSRIRIDITSSASAPSDDASPRIPLIQVLNADQHTQPPASSILSRNDNPVFEGSKEGDPRPTVRKTTDSSLLYHEFDSERSGSPERGASVEPGKILIQEHF